MVQASKLTWFDYLKGVGPIVMILGLFATSISWKKDTDHKHDSDVQALEAHCEDSAKEFQAAKLFTSRVNVDGCKPSVEVRRRITGMEKDISTNQAHFEDIKIKQDKMIEMLIEIKKNGH